MKGIPRKILQQQSNKKIFCPSKSQHQQSRTALFHKKNFVREKELTFSPSLTDICSCSTRASNSENISSQMVTIIETTSCVLNGRESQFLCSVVCSIYSKFPKTSAPDILDLGATGRPHRDPMCPRISLDEIELPQSQLRCKERKGKEVLRELCVDKVAQLSLLFYL